MRGQGGANRARSEKDLKCVYIYSPRHPIEALVCDTDGNVPKPGNTNIYAKQQNTYRAKLLSPLVYTLVSDATTRQHITCEESPYIAGKNSPFQRVPLDTAKAAVGAAVSVTENGRRTFRILTTEGARTANVSRLMLNTGDLLPLQNH